MVEKFFDRRVRYLITNRHVHKTKAKTSTCSPLTLSPNTPEGTGSPAAVAAQAQSPAEAGKLKAVPVAYRTRGGTILASSVSQTQWFYAPPPWPLAQLTLNPLPIAFLWGEEYQCAAIVV